MVAIAHPPLAPPCDRADLRLVRRAPAPRYAVRRLAAVAVLVLALPVGASAVRAGTAALAALAPEPAAVAVLPPAIAVPPAVHVVAPGDTYWSIAVSLGRSGDVREVVDELIASNGAGTLHPGDGLTLPVP
jgi:hypothetical protein